MTDIFALPQASLQGSEFELVDVERAQGGVLRVVIDHPEGVNVDHCEDVSRQLSRVFEVEDVDYNRLEVASPGVNRPLKRLADYLRFAGHRVELRLYEALENQKVFRGVLHVPDIDQGQVDQDRKSTRLNSSHVAISYAVFCLKQNQHNIFVRAE